MDVEWMYYHTGNAIFRFEYCLEYDLVIVYQIYSGLFGLSRAQNEEVAMYIFSALSHTQTEYEIRV